MDKRVMLRWVEDVLPLYVALAPPGLRSLVGMNDLGRNYET